MNRKLFVATVITCWSPKHVAICCHVSKPWQRANKSIWGDSNIFQNLQVKAEKGRITGTAHHHHGTSWFIWQGTPDDEIVDACWCCLNLSVESQSVCSNCCYAKKLSLWTAVGWIPNHVGTKQVCAPGYPSPGCWLWHESYRQRRTPWREQVAWFHSIHPVQQMMHPRLLQRHLKAPNSTKWFCLDLTAWKQRESLWMLTE